MAARAAMRADRVTAAAASALSQAAPEFDALVANFERQSPARLAPWTSNSWNEFARSPKSETPNEICVARVQEAGLPGEQTIRAPKMVPLLAAKGPSSCAATAHRRNGRER